MHGRFVKASQAAATPSAHAEQPLRSSRRGSALVEPEQGAGPLRELPAGNSCLVRTPPWSFAPVDISPDPSSIGSSEVLMLGDELGGLYGLAPGSEGCSMDQHVPWRM